MKFDQERITSKRLLFRNFVTCLKNSTLSNLHTSNRVRLRGTLCQRRSRRESMDKSDNNHEIRLAAAKRTDHDSLEFVQV